MFLDSQVAERSDIQSANLHKSQKYTGSSNRRTDRTEQKALTAARLDSRTPTSSSSQDEQENKWPLSKRRRREEEERWSSHVLLFPVHPRLLPVEMGQVCIHSMQRKHWTRDCMPDLCQQMGGGTPLLHLVCFRRGHLSF